MSEIKTDKKSKLFDDIRKELFKVESLEPRVLLSADPLIGAAQVVAPLSPTTTTVTATPIATGTGGATTPTTITTAAASATAVKIDAGNLYQSLTGNTIASSSNTSQTNNNVVIDMAVFNANKAAINADVQVSSGEVLGGSGTLDHSLFNDGVVSPGYSPGVLNVTGDYSQTGNLKIELGGNTAGTGAGHYDQVNVSGNASLAGTLAVSLFGGFNPNVGDTFDIMTFGSATDLTMG